VELPAELVPIQRQTRFDPQAVASAQPARQNAQRLACFENQIPQASGLLRIDEQLDTDVRTGVSGPADQAIDPADLLLDECEALEFGDPPGGRPVGQFAQCIEGRRPLQSQIRPAIRGPVRVPHVLDRRFQLGQFSRPRRGLGVDDRPALLQLAQIEPDLGLIGRVDHDHEAGLAPAIDDDIVQHVAGGIEDVAVPGPAQLEILHLVGTDDLQEQACVRPGDLQNAHVRAIEQACLLSNRPMLLRDRRIPQRHQIARKRRDVRLARDLDVLVVQHARRRH